MDHSPTLARFEPGRDCGIAEKPRRGDSGSRDGYGDRQRTFGNQNASGQYSERFASEKVQLASFRRQSHGQSCRKGMEGLSRDVSAIEDDLHPSPVLGNKV